MGCIQAGTARAGESFPIGIGAPRIKWHMKSQEIKGRAAPKEGEDDCAATEEILTQI